MNKCIVKFLAAAAVAAAIIPASSSAEPFPAEPDAPSQFPTRARDSTVFGRSAVSVSAPGLL